MYQASLNAYNPQFRSAVQALNSDPQYFRQDDLELARTADAEPWIPSEDILELVPKASQIPISHIDKQTDLTRVLLELIESHDVSLVLFGEQVKARNRPTIIVMSTRSHHFVIEPNCQTGIDFLGRCLQESNIRFWTTGGLYDACCLWHQYKISLKGSNAKDCLGLHLRMMKLLAHVEFQPGHGEANNYHPMYPSRALQRAKHTKTLESFENLARLWLDLNNSRSIEIDSSQLKHLVRRPLDTTGENLIRKRCSLVISLAMKLLHYATIEMEIMNENVLKSLTFCHSDFARKALRKHLFECETLKIPHPVYLAHMERHASLYVTPTAGTS